jgi:uncharacterized membrane protein YciS (DUF1049 family)
MRLLCLVFLAVFTVAIIAFACFNPDPITVKFLESKFTTNLSVIIGAVYVLGMLSGSIVWRILRRSATTVIESV